MGTFDISKKKIEEFKSKYRGATDTLGSSRPNKTKEMLKKAIKEDMEGMEQMADCKELYENIYKKGSI